MSKETSAWLIEANGGYRFVVADYEMVEYVMSPQTMSIPLTPEYASSVINWQNKYVAVLDFGLLIERVRELNYNTCVLAYQRESGESLQHLAVALPSAPQKIWVSDTQASEEDTERCSLWRYLANGWINHEGEILPIINIQKLASNDFARRINRFRLETVPAFLHTAEM